MLVVNYLEQGEWLTSGYNYILHKELLVELTQDSWVGSG